MEEVSSQPSPGEQLTTILTLLQEQSQRMKRQEELAEEHSRALKRLEDENKGMQIQITGMSTNRPGTSRRFNTENMPVMQPLTTPEHLIPSRDSGKKHLVTITDADDSDAGTDIEAEAPRLTEPDNVPPSGLQAAYPADRTGRPQWIPTTTQSAQSSESIEHAKLQKELKELKEAMFRLPGVPQPLLRASSAGFADSPFIPEIASKEMPERFSYPVLPKYDGTTDPDEHMAQYRQILMAAVVPPEKREACMCRGFGISLVGPALYWWTNIPPGSITSFAHLTDLFVQQFASSRKLQKTSDDLYRVLQRPGETTREILTRFTKEMVSIPHCDPQVTVAAF